MKKVIARLVVRDTNDPTDGLLLGCVFKTGRGRFKPGHVYELRVWADEIADALGADEESVDLVDVGESCIARDMTVCGPGHNRYCCWGNSVSGVLNGSSGGYLVLTRNEFAKRGGCGY